MCIWASILGSSTISAPLVFISTLGNLFSGKISPVSFPWFVSTGSISLHEA